MAEESLADVRSPASSPAHADNIPTPSSTTRPRPTHRRGLKRGVAACERCRRRKQKCDGQLPVCGQCSAAGTSCVPSERFLVRVASADCECERLRRQVESLTAQLESVTAAVAVGDGTAGSGLASARGESSAIHRSPSVRMDGAASSNVSLDRLLRPTFSRSDTATAGDEALMNSPSRLWDGLSTGRRPESLDSVTCSSLEDNNHLVEGFFARRWPQFPVLHKPTFLQKHYLPFTRGESVSGVSSFQVNIVLSIAASERSRTDERHRRLQQDFFQAASRSLGAALAADDLDCVQCLLLLCIYGSNEPQSVDLWYAVGMALRLAIGMNLHRAENLASKEPLEAEMCKRLFWCVYTMDRSVSMSLGLPLGIQDADISVPLPLSISDDVLADPTRETPLSFGGPDVDDLSTFLHIVQLRRINADIYRSLHSAGDADLAGADIDAIRARHHARLNQWLASAPRYLAPPASMHQTPEWFQIAHHQAVMNLYRPSHASPVSTADALRHCADSAISLVSCYGALYAKNSVTYTYVALTSLFMAGVTMLYALRASPALRQDLTRAVVDSNIRSCATLLRDVSHGGEEVERGVRVIRRLGRATLLLFAEGGAGEPPDDGRVDTEFMSWFGLRGHRRLRDHGSLASAQDTPSADVPWNDLFEHGFEMGNIYYGDFLI
ncbi:Pyrimidine pathway regulatory protein 1 [Colletotrichum orbiculare MAFF 240422]|uniref:Pyrimidine pathway regulatory protein 1 n=1 Tax=Colletotrichum orbiculare (strain 104-T / ATCC 96160 / CBS 514.97 / LARS 414 / MAFF 240422) TaxID=1213857 RepID=A0A484FVK3_COLOR|nr:Pyrimidine pathway regulatory protein 1 [Colletotrichum orbiculare MAFF 240422]